MRRLNISFSGGRTSGRMLKALLERRHLYDAITVTFCNTGCEDPRTLDFVNRVDREFRADVVWLEAVVDPRAGEGTTHRVVSYETACRDGSVFEAVIAKYGIPNPSHRGNCTRELKLRPITSYLRSLGWEANSYDTAIGIRADEIDRMDPKAREKRIIYPLVGAGITKPMVLQWWRSQSFDLDLPEHYGNCVWCWKKSLRKHLTLAAENPSVFDFPARMERLYANAGAGDGNRRFFREHRSVADIIKLAQLPFVPFAEHQEAQLLMFVDEMDRGSGPCGNESCEVYEVENAA